MLILNKTFTFCAAHRYWNPDLGEEGNRAVFGKDVRLHGHNYELTVGVTGAVNPATGFLADLDPLQALVNERVVEVLDHSRIDTDIPWFAGRQPSTENLLLWIWQEIAPRLTGCRLVRLRLQETPTIFTEYYGPEGFPLPGA